MAVEVGNNERLKKRSFSTFTEDSEKLYLLVCARFTALKSDFAKKFVKSQNMSTRTTLL